MRIYILVVENRSHSLLPQLPQPLIVKSELYAFLSPYVINVLWYFVFLACFLPSKPFRGTIFPLIVS